MINSYIIYIQDKADLVPDDIGTTMAAACQVQAVEQVSHPGELSHLP